MPLTLPIIPISKKYLFRELWKNLSNCGYPILRYFCCGPKYLNTYFIDHPDFGIHLLAFQNWGFTVHKNDFLCNTRFLSNFPRTHCRDIFSKIGMGNVRGITKNVPNLQVYEHTPATPTTLSIKVVIVVLCY